MAGPTGVVPFGCVGVICHVVEARSLPGWTGLARRRIPWAHGRM